MTNPVLWQCTHCHARYTLPAGDTPVCPRCDVRKLNPAAAGMLADAVGMAVHESNARHGFTVPVTVGGIQWTVTARPDARSSEDRLARQAEIMREATEIMREYRGGLGSTIANMEDTARALRSWSGQ